MDAVRREIVSPQHAISPPARQASAQGLSVGAPAVLKELLTRQKRRRYFRVFAFAADLAAIALAFAIASVARFGAPTHEQALTMLGVIVPVYLMVALNHKAYHIYSVVDARIGGWSAVAAFMITVSVVGLVTFFLKVSTEFSRATFGAGALCALALLPFFRWMLARTAQRIFGDSPINQVIIEDEVTVSRERGTVVLNAQQDGLVPRLDDPVMLDRLGRYLHNADRVIVACPRERRSAWTIALRGIDVNAEVFAQELDDLGAVSLGRYEGRSTLVVAAGPLGIIDRSLKRAFDLLFALLSLPILLPVMAAVAIAIRLESPGPILFTQERVGLGNRLFKLYKFRSMRVDGLDEPGHLSTGRNDDRVTRVGRTIRTTSLDELPQLFNVLTGAMSIVGPRPHALGSRAEDQLFWDIDLAYWHRHAVKPGITGLAQVRGYRGTTETTSDLTNRLRADLEYLNGWSIWRDVGIVFATFRVLIHRNAF